MVRSRRCGRPGRLGVPEAAQPPGTDHAFPPATGYRSAGANRSDGAGTKTIPSLTGYIGGSCVDLPNSPRTKGFGTVDHDSPKKSRNSSRRHTGRGLLQLLVVLLDHIVLDAELLVLGLHVGQHAARAAALVSAVRHHLRGTWGRRA